MENNSNKDLKYYLINIPEGVLRTLIGQKICDSIIQYNLFKDDLHVDYVDILVNKFGKNILFDKNVFRKLIIFLDEKYIKNIAEDNKIVYSSIDQAREKLSRKSFGYKSEKFSLSIIKILELNKDKYFPNPIEIEENFVIQVEPNYRLHEYQKNLKDEIVRFLLNPQFTNRMLVHMPTGAGKTKTAMEVVSDYLRCKSVLGGHEKNVFIVWLAHSKELCEQALDAFQNTWRLRGDYVINTYKLFGDSEYPQDILNTDRAFVFASFQKLNSMLNANNLLQIQIKDKIFKNVKLVIVDEAHKSMANTYEKGINLLTRNNAGVQLIGLTATPGRSSDQDSGENNFLAEFFNSTKIGMIDTFGHTIPNPISYLQDLEVLAKIDRIQLFTDVQISLSVQQIKNLKMFGDEKLAEILSDLAGNPGRNKIIVDKIIELYELSESILIFACNVEHCIILQTILKKSGIDSGTILSSTSKFDRENSINRFKSGDLKILINYGVLTTGFDAPKLNTLIIARPTTSLVLYSQMVGRALRGPKNGGNKVNKLIDLRDNFTFGTESQMFNFYDEIWSN
jgi:superfamily II DNA or RNA helicase